MAERMVQCKKFDEQLPGLEKAPFPGEIGELIFDHVSQKAWDLWNNDMLIKVLNEHRLNMGDNNDYQAMKQSMLAFFNLIEDDGEQK